METGRATVEKGSGIFNAGKVVIKGIASGRNRSAITATITAKSKKKVVFSDASCVHGTGRAAGCRRAR